MLLTGAVAEYRPSGAELGRVRPRLQPIRAGGDRAVWPLSEVVRLLGQGHVQLLAGGIEDPDAGLEARPISRYPARVCDQGLLLRSHLSWPEPNDFC